MRKLDFCSNCAADQHLCFRNIDKENPLLVFSGGQGNPNPMVHRPEGWDFPFQLYTNDRFYFSHI